MAKPIRPDPTFSGKAAKEFEKRFLSDKPVGPVTVKRNKKAVEIYESTPATQ